MYITFIAIVRVYQVMIDRKLIVWLLEELLVLKFPTGTDSRNLSLLLNPNKHGQHGTVHFKEFLFFQKYA